MLRFTGKAMLVASVLAMLAGLAMLAVPALRQQIPFHWKVPIRAWWSDIRIDENIDIRSSDGTVMRATLLRPEAAPGPLPTIYLRSPYDRHTGNGGLGNALFFARHGYAVLVQDVRGTGGSEGEFMPWQYAGIDGEATLAWIAAQPWANGRVGTFGCSALGELQFPLARLGNSAHRAMIASGAGGAIGSARRQFAYFGVYEGGIFELASGFGWFAKHGQRLPGATVTMPLAPSVALRGLPLAELIERVAPGANGFRKFVSLPLDDPQWARFDYVMEGDRLHTPALLVNTWGDQTVSGTLALADLARANPPLTGKTKVILGAGDHCEHDTLGKHGRWGELSVENAARPYDDWALAWFAYWLRDEDNGIDALPNYQFFVVGENRWLASAQWPPATARTQRWYLSSAGGANSSSGDGVLQQQPTTAPAVDSYRYDPDVPVPTRGGPVCCTGDAAIRSGPVDQRDVEQRDDVLVYTSEPLTEPLRIVGPLRAHLVVSSSARDTDFVARLVDVWPDGHAINIQEGALRARYRNGMAKPQLLTPDETTTLIVEMRDIAWRLAKGHRLRLDITSSSFPRLERNLNTGGNNFAESKGVIAITRIHHGPAEPSRIELYVLDDAASIDAPMF